MIKNACVVFQITFLMMIQKYNMTPNATVTQPNEKRGGGGGDENENVGEMKM